MSNPTIYDTKHYKVEIGECVLEGPWKGIEAYLVINKRTGVLEGEVSIEKVARQMCIDLSNELEDHLNNPDSGHDEDTDFDNLLAALAESGENNPV